MGDDGRELTRVTATDPQRCCHRADSTRPDGLQMGCRAANEAPRFQSFVTGFLFIGFTITSSEGVEEASYQSST